MNLMMSRRYALVLGACIVSATIAPAASAADRSLAVMPIAPTGGFDPEIAAAFETELRKELRNNSANRLVPEERVAALAGRPLEDVAKAVDARFVFAATIDKDIDAVSLRWEVFDTVAGKVASRGISPGDIDNMEFLPIETAVGLNILLDQLLAAAP